MHLGVDADLTRGSRPFILKLKCYKNVNGVLHMKNKKNTLKLTSVLLASTLFLGACSNPFDSLANGINDLLGNETSEEETDNESTEAEQANEADNESTETKQTGETETSENSDETKEEVEKLDYSHLMGEGEETTLGEGKHKVGSDIPPGRYMITTENPEERGNVFIYNEEDLTELNAIIAGEEAEISGASKAVTFLDEDYSIEIMGMENIVFAPYETDDVNELIPGKWVVGQDFPAGVYDLSLEETDEFGTLQVGNQPDQSKARYSLGSTEYGGMTEFTASFEEGDIVELEHIPKVTLSER